MAAPAIVSVENLTRQFGAITAVAGISFEIEEGAVFGLLGPNGAGKSTTISTLATLLPPTSGTARVAGFDVVRQGRRVREIIGLVPQELALYPRLSGLDNLYFFGATYGLAGGVLRKRVREVLGVVALEERAGDRVEHYSGGMKRRLNLAIGLLHRPRVLFLDEPTVGVDPQSRSHIFESVLRLNREAEMTIVYTTHYMEEAQHLCQRVGIIDEGKLVAMDAPRDLINRLGTGVIQLTVEGDPAALVGRLASLPMVQAASAHENTVEARVGDTHAALAAVMDVVGSLGLHVGRLEIAEPNLESVFLAMTGKHLRE